MVISCISTNMWDTLERKETRSILQLEAKAPASRMGMHNHYLDISGHISSEHTSWLLRSYVYWSIFLSYCIYIDVKKIQIFSNAQLNITSPTDTELYNFNTFFRYSAQNNSRLGKNCRRPSAGKISRRAHGNPESYGKGESKINYLSSRGA